MSSTFKAFLAGLSTVAVAVVLGFSGGIFIADRFSSDTAVQEQTKIERQKAGDESQRAGHAKAADVRPAAAQSSEMSSEIVATKPVRVETTGAATGGEPVATELRGVTATAPVGASAQASPHANPQAPAQTATPAIPATAQRQQAVPAQPVRSEPAWQRRNDARKEARPQDRNERRRAAREEGRRPIETDGAAARNSSIDDEDFADADVRPQRRRVTAPRQTREVLDDVDERAEVIVEHRRPPVLPPFFGLFGR